MKRSSYPRGRSGLRAFVAALAVFVLGAGGALALPVTAHAQDVTYQIVTNEIKADQGNGKVVEVYRFDPSVYVVNEGDNVTLKFRGLKGHDHPITLDGYNLNGVVQRNHEISLHFTANKPGFFHLVCTSHADAAHEGPMEAYVVVVPKAK